MRIADRGGLRLVAVVVLSLTGSLMAAAPVERVDVLLPEILKALDLNPILNGAVNCTFRVSSYQADSKINGDLTAFRTTTVDAHRINPDLLRVDGKSWEGGASQPKEGVYIRNGKQAWRAQPDRETGKFFLSEYGEDMVTGQEIEYLSWVNAPYMIGVLPLADYLRGGTTQTVSEIQSIEELADESGERLLRCVLRLKNRSNPHGSPPSQLSALLYRDRLCVIKSATLEGVSSTGDKTILIRSCDYAAFTAMDRPVPLIVTETWKSQPAGAPDTEYKTYLQKVAEYSRYSFETPDSANFDITQLVDMPARIETHDTNSVKWFFGLNGLVLLALWYLLSRRKRKPSNLQSIA